MTNAWAVAEEARHNAARHSHGELMGALAALSDTQTELEELQMALVLYSKRAPLDRALLAKCLREIQGEEESDG